MSGESCAGPNQLMEDTPIRLPLAVLGWGAHNDFQNNMLNELVPARVN